MTIGPEDGTGVPSGARSEEERFPMLRGRKVARTKGPHSAIPGKVKLGLDTGRGLCSHCSSCQYNSSVPDPPAAAAGYCSKVGSLYSPVGICQPSSFED
nr:hypothetical protein TEA_011296 [Ipomoea batatas]